LVTLKIYYIINDRFTVFFDCGRYENLELRDEDGREEEGELIFPIGFIRYSPT
jgi:hypothetical protein